MPTVTDEEWFEALDCPKQATAVHTVVVNARIQEAAGVRSAYLTSTGPTRAEAMADVRRQHEALQAAGEVQRSAQQRERDKASFARPRHTWTPSTGAVRGAK